MANPWYRSGTVTVTNNLKTVTGTGTLWVVNSVSNGDIFFAPDGLAYEVDTIENDTQITLKNVYQGATQSGQPYGLVRFMSQSPISLANLIVGKTVSWENVIDQLSTYINGNANTSSVAPEDLCINYSLGTVKTGIAEVDCPIGFTFVANAANLATGWYLFSDTVGNYRVAQHPETFRAEINAIKDATDVIRIAAEVAQAGAEAALYAAQPYLMTKADYEALAQANRDKFAGSGFVNYGSNHTSLISQNVNRGIFTYPTYVNHVRLSVESLTLAKDNGGLPKINANGSIITISHIADPSLESSKLLFPPAPTVTHADATNSGLITNGTFDADTTGWVSGNGAILSSVGGNLRIQGNGVSVNPYAYTSFASVIGETYTFQIECVNATSGFMQLGESVATVGSRSTTTTGATGVYTVTHVATTTTTYARIGFGSATTDSTVDNASVIPKSALSRQDFAFLETWHEDISLKGNFVYPLGNVQYLGGDTDGLTGIAAGAFIGADTYSLMGAWQTAGALVGKGYDWDLLTDAQKAAFAGNPDNGIYLDGGTIYQRRYAARTFEGTKDYGSWDAFATEQGYTQDTVDKGLWWSGTTAIIPIGLVQRPNQGAYHPVYNKYGTRKVLNTTNTLLVEWHDLTAKQITSTIDAFDFSSSWVGGVAGGILPPESNTTGSIAGTTANAGAPDGKFYDAIYASAIIDLRNSSHKNPIKENMLSVVQKVINGTKRSDYDGDGEWELVRWYRTVGLNLIYDYNDGRIALYGDFSAGLSAGDITQGTAFVDGVLRPFKARVVTASGSSVTLTSDAFLALTSSGYVVADGIKYVELSVKSTRKSSGEKLHCDLIGDPAFYPKTAIDYTTTGAIQTVSVVKGNKVFYAVASSVNPLFGTVGNYYVAKTAQASIDLNTQDFSNTTNWLDTGSTNTVDWQGDLANGYTGSFTPLVVGENGEDYVPDSVTTTFKLSHKDKSVALVLKSSDSGITWSVLAVTTDYTVSTTANTITYTTAPAVGDIITVFYTTTDNYTYPVPHSIIQPSEAGMVEFTCASLIGYGNGVLSSLINKVGTYGSGSDMNFNVGFASRYSTDITGALKTAASVFPAHDAIQAPATSSPSAKFLPVAVSENGRLCVDLHFKEMKYDDATVNEDGTPTNTWGDDSLINIVDNVTTTIDDNGNTVLIGTKRIKTEFFA